MKARRMRWEEHVARMGKKRNAYRLLVEKPEGKRPLGRPRRSWMKKKKGFAGIDSIGVAQDRDKWRALVNAVMNYAEKISRCFKLCTLFAICTSTFNKCCDVMSRGV
jgi:hypothetical protein